MNSKLSLANWLQLQAESTDENLCFLLSAQQVQLFLVALENYRYKTRYYNADTFDRDANDLMLDESVRILLSPLNLCQLIADCITDTESPTYQALVDLIQGQIDNANNPLVNPYNPETGIALVTTEIANGGSDCDLDILYGAISQIVDFVDSAIVDAFQLIESATNEVEVLAIELRGTPAIGELPADEALDLANHIQENLAENYLAFMTNELRESIKCALFCLARDNGCSLTFEMMSQYFGSQISLETIQISMLSFMTGYFTTFIGDQIVYASLAMLCGALAHGDKFYGIDSFNFLIAIFASYQNDPNSDWLTLCTDCNDWIILYTNQTTDFGNPTWTVGGIKSDTVDAPYGGYIDTPLTLNLPSSRLLNTVTIRLYRGGAQVDRRFKVTANGNSYYSNSTTGSGLAELACDVGEICAEFTITFIETTNDNTLSQNAVLWIEAKS